MLVQMRVPTVVMSGNYSSDDETLLQLRVPSDDDM
jgi:hypothetical protein